MAFDPSGQPRPLLPTNPFYNAVTKPNQVMLLNSIPAEVEKAQNGDQILVGPGTYPGNVVINKNIALLSTTGADVTIIDGNNSGNELGTIVLTNGRNGVRIGAIGQGFTVKGIDGAPGLEKAALYLQLAQTNITIEGNIIEARGDAGLMGEYNAVNTNITINANTFSGKTFLGDNPAGVGFSAQYSLSNVPRQLVVFGGGSGTTNTQNFTFTNNILSGITGGMSITADNGTAIPPTPQGNTIASLEFAGSNTISGNTFSGTTTRYAEALRMRGPGSYTFAGNVFNGTYPVIATAATATPATGLARISDLLANSTFTKYAVVRSGGLLAVAAISPSINGAIAAAVAGQEVYVSAGTFTEDVLINKPLTLTGANANISYGTGRVPESIVQPLTSGGAAISLGTGVGPNNVTINGFEITGPMSENGIKCGDTGPSYLNIKYNYFHHIGSDRSSQNIYAINYRCAELNQTDINFSYNYFDHIYNTLYPAQLKSSAAIWLGQSPATGTISNVVIEYNTIMNVFRPAGNVFGDDGPNVSGINIGCGWKSTGKLQAPVIRYNTISDLSGGVVYGIALQGNTPGAQIYGNTFDNLSSQSAPDHAAAVCVFNNVGYSTNNGTGITAYNNSFPNTYYGIYNATTNQINGLSNWWGDATGPFHATTNPDGLGCHVSDYVTYDPWFANEAMTLEDSNAPVENITQNTFDNTIQAAIVAATPGDEIVVAPGTYMETVTIDKAVSLKSGEYRDLPIIDGGGVGSTVTISANGAVLQGFKIQNSGTGAADAGVKLQGFNDCQILDNEVTGNGHGIAVAMGTGNLVKQNNVHGNLYYGIALVAAMANTVELNNVNNNGLDGIAIENANVLGGPVSMGSTGNFIKGNTISAARDGIFIGELCSGNFVTDGNTISGVSNALHIWHIGHETVTGNTLVNSGNGIRLLGSTFNTITGNTIAYNTNG
ncbi:MAG TPA: right-handed parallel beta-helix repeat-containing protein, partial [Candidatus Cloacimonadota bacterium]|nr:right-handed parallel beta-helix repeat-containing protein [Candidatus Cloacimonadota bacterium]